MAKTVVVTALGAQGDGVCEGPIYVSRALPGERIEGDIIDGRIDMPKVLEPSSERVRPPCRHYKTCGGCALQHASDPFVARWKREIVVNALARQGLSAPVNTHVETSPAESRRRAKFTARRTKTGAMAGFMGRASHNLVDVTSCAVLDRRLAQGPDLARALAKAGGSRKGQIEVHCTATNTGMDVAVQGGKPLDRDLLVTLPAIATQFGCVRLTWDGELVAQSQAVLHKIGHADVVLPASAFLQATDHGEETLQRLVHQMMGTARNIADLFAGCGTFALDLAARAPVSAFEGEKSMVLALQQAANHAEITFPVKSSTRDLFRDPLTAQELSKFDAIVMDPPRAGAVAQTAQIAQSNVPIIAYVSCEPVSFSRDAARLVAAGYSLDFVQVVDQFRWSTHVELAARFSASHMQRGAR